MASNLRGYPYIKYEIESILIKKQPLQIKKSRKSIHYLLNHTKKNPLLTKSFKNN